MKNQWRLYIFGMANLVVVISVFFRVYSSSERLPIYDQVRTLSYTQCPTANASTELEIFGRSLFFDKRFSINGKVACSTCHQPERAFTDGKQTSLGVGMTGRNAPTIINTRDNFWFFWDGRSDSLEAQALGPIENPVEHGISRAHIARILNSYYSEQYEALFGKLEFQNFKSLPEEALPVSVSPPLSKTTLEFAYATLSSDKVRDAVNQSAKVNLSTQAEALRKFLEESDIHSENSWNRAYETLSHFQQDQLNQIFANFGKAIAAYEKTIYSCSSPFDQFVERWKQNESGLPYDALNTEFNSAALRGLTLFTGRGNCILCHNGPNLTDSQFHNIGLSLNQEEIPIGRANGIKIVQASIFNCHGKYFAQSSLESCRELDYLNSSSPEFVGAFKTPSLRNLDLTGPYMHDGRFTTLRDVLNFYSKLDVLPALGIREESLKPLHLTEDETSDLETFLRSLNGPIYEGGQIHLSH